MLCRQWLETTLSIGAPPGLSPTAALQPTSSVPRRSGFGRRVWQVLLALALASVLAPAAASALVCGDGILDLLEECDLGAANGASDSCCTSSCTFRPAGEVCRPAVGACDAVEACTGLADFCPPDLKSIGVCRDRKSVV